MKMVLPKDVQNIIATLQMNGHEAYAVGGCVRDCVLGKEPNDWDITTSAKPEAVKALFERTIDTGIEHGTVTIMVGATGYEVTTYRIDGKYEDGRHPTEVTFTASLEEDLKRRDFTINAMAYNDQDGLVDIFCGMDDLENGIIRAVGNPVERFSEDALRMLRAMRFAAQLGFEVEADTYDAICKLAPTLEKVSAERIQVELVKLLCSSHPELIRDTYKSGLTRVFLPEFDRMMETEQNCRHHCYSVGEHTIKALETVPADKVLRLTMLLHDVAKPNCRRVDEEGKDHFKGHPVVGADMAKEILQRLKFDNDTIRKVCRLVKYHDERPQINRVDIRKAIVKIGPDAFPQMLDVKDADIAAQSQYKRESKIENMKEFRRIYQEIIDEGDCIRMSDMKITGKDLMSLGLPQGQRIGEVLNALFERVVEDCSLNDHEYLMAEAAKLI